VLYLSSAGDATPCLQDAIRIYLEGKVEAGDKVEIVEFNDANPVKNPWAEQPIYQEVKKITQGMGYRTHAIHYELFKLHKVDQKRLDDIYHKLLQPGTICIVVGGNTWRLASAFEPLKGLRALIGRLVAEGDLMYVSFSAGTIMAGPSVSLARDSQQDVIQEGGAISEHGLDLVQFALRPHAQSDTSRRAGQEFADRVAAGHVNDRAGNVLACEVKYIADGDGLLVLGDSVNPVPAAAQRVRNYVRPEAKAKAKAKARPRAPAASINEQARVYNADIQQWATKSPDKTKEHCVKVPTGRTLSGLVVYEQPHYGIIDIALVDDSGKRYRATNLPDATKEHKFMIPAGAPCIGLKVHEQSKYGIVDLQWVLKGEAVTEPAIGLIRNAHRNFSLKIPGEMQINGMVVREQSGYGVIDVRFLVEPGPACA